MDEAPEGAHVSIYADDIAVWASHQGKKVAFRRVQEAVEAFSDSSKNHRITLNTAKCEVDFFSSSQKEVVVVSAFDIGMSTLPCK